MFNSSQKNFQRRVHISHKHGAFIVQIARHNDRSTYIMMLLMFTAVFVFFIYIFIHPFFNRTATLNDLFYISPFIAFVLWWYVVGVRIAVWRAFGIEQITVDGGLFMWTRTALFWKRKLEIPPAEVTSVKAITPWHALSNRVEFTAADRRRCIGDMLLRDEAMDIAHELSHAIGIAK